MNLIGNFIKAALILCICIAPVVAASNHVAASIHYAAMMGDTTKIKQLLADGVDIDAQDENGRTPLHIASYLGQLKAVKLLVKKGANVNARDNGGWTPLHSSIPKGFIKVSKYLIGKGADINARETKHNGLTPMHMAVIFTSGDLIKMLIDEDARINEKDDKGKTPLYYAQRNGHLKTADMLKIYGATSDGIELQALIFDSEKDRTFYFNNNEARLCFSFSLPAEWLPTDESGLLESKDHKEQAGVLLLTEQDLTEFKDKTLVARAASAHLKSFEASHRQPAKISDIEDFESLFPESIKWSARWELRQGGQDYIAEVVRYMAEVKPGRVAVVTASHPTDRDDTAGAIFKSMRFTTDPDCFTEEIRQLRNK